MLYFKILQTTGLTALGFGLYQARSLARVSAYHEASAHDLDKTILRITAAFFAFYTHMTVQAQVGSLQAENELNLMMGLCMLSAITELAQVILQVVFLEFLRERVRLQGIKC